MLAGSLVDNAFAWDHGVDLAASMLLWWVICLHTSASILMRPRAYGSPLLGALPAASFLMIIHVFLDIVSVGMTMPP